MYGFETESKNDVIQDNIVVDPEIHEAIPMEMFEAMSGMPEETEVAPADDIIIAEE